MRLVDRVEIKYKFFQKGIAQQCQIVIRNRVVINTVIIFLADSILDVKFVSQISGPEPKYIEIKSYRTILNTIFNGLTN